MDLTAFAAEVGHDDRVTCVGGRTQWDVGGTVDPAAREVRAPAGISSIAPEEMTVTCGAGTTVVELLEALARHRQTVALPAWASATVGGVLAVGHSGVERLGHGPVRDTVLQARVVVASGVVVKAGGPTVKNVSGYDLCRLLVGSLGTLAFVGEVILRTRPVPQIAQWYAGSRDPFEVRARVHAPASILWDGSRTWALLEGAAPDVRDEAAKAGLEQVDGPPALPTGGRWSLPAAELRNLSGSFVAEVGVGVVHTDQPAVPKSVTDEVRRLHRDIKARFDPAGRLNPGRMLVA